MMRSVVYVLVLFAILFGSGFGLWRWMLDTWQDSPLDRYGPVFMSSAVALLVLTLLNAKSILTSRLYLAALPVLLTSLLLNWLARDYDIFIFTALTLLPIAGASIWLLFGPAMLLRGIPALMLMFISLPGVPFVMVAYTPGNLLELKLTVAALFVALSAWLLFRGAAPLVEAIGRLSALATTRVSLLGITLIGLLVAGVTPKAGVAVSVDTAAHQINQWRGVPLEVGAAESDLFEGARISKYVFAHPNGSSLSVLKVEGDNVHDIHPPEYCLTGANWVLQGRTPKTIEFEQGSARATALDLTRAGQRIHSIYWFNNGADSLASVADLRMSRRTNKADQFALYMVTSIRTDGTQSESELVSNFLSEVL